MPETHTVAELHRLAVSALNRGDLRGMVAHCKALLGVEANHADAWFLLSIAAEAQRDLSRALGMVERADTLHPGNSEYLAQKAKLLVQLRRLPQARTAAQAALAAGPERALTLDTLGVVLTRLGDHQRAAATLRAAVQKAPDNPQFHFNLAAAEQFLGNVEAARRHYEQALELQPGFARAYWALAELEKNAPDPQRRDRLEKLFAASGDSPADRLYLGHALARAREQAGDYSGAFSALEAAKATRRAALQDSSIRDRTLFGELRGAFRDRDEQCRPAPGGINNPLFVVGMPRTGTTLLEQMLAAHPAIDTLGELQDFPLAVRAACASTTAPMLDTEVIAAARAAAAESLATRYQAALAALLPAQQAGKRYLIDKMPLNVLYVGFILQAFPAARIVLVRRNPLDTCLSNFRQLFAVDFSYYNYAYSLEDTARYYLEFDTLCRHWQALYGPRIHTLEYEQLVASPRETLAAVLQYLDLPWAEDCLDFHRRGGVVTTASTVQVREPLYRSAVGRWRRYEQELAPAMALFDAAGIRYR
ncbi:tetratricopeptide repeat-containing sulfotransferase family protein [Haliea sp. E17]|uniref:tetratricopeptide repeat-containing sulfotransferase family protein n=1 Tax=Haliea sp. E17 TaxID=3401576 RepID=UPI003AAA3BE3